MLQTKQKIYIFEIQNIKNLFNSYIPPIVLGCTVHKRILKIGAQRGNPLVCLSVCWSVDMSPKRIGIDSRAALSKTFDYSILHKMCPARKSS